MQQALRTLMLSGGLALGVACAGKGQSSSPAPAPARNPPPRSNPAPSPSANRDSVAKPAADTTWVKSDSGTKTVSLSLLVTRPSGSPSALINGYRSGEAQILVPVGWTVKWDWKNQDSASPHSLVVMVQREKLPLEGGRAAFSNAMSRSVTSGLESGQGDQTTFEADEAGWYWLMCGVPSHALNGEWLELRVSPDAHSGGVQLKKR
jgi:Sulfocyanin (SoxE) domain